MTPWHPDDPNAPFQEGVVPPTVPDDVRGRGHGGTGTASGQGSPGRPMGPPSGGGSGPSTGPGVPIAFPADIFPPPGGLDFNQFGQSQALDTAATTSPATGPLGIVLVPGITASFTGNGLSFQVPPLNIAVVRDVSIFVNAMVITTDIRWRLTQDGSIIPGWELSISPRAAGSVEISFIPQSTLVRIREGALIELAIEVVDAGTYQAGGQFHGWVWPPGN